MGLPRETGRHTATGVMEPIVNLAEQPGKVVGRRGALSGDHDRPVRNAAALMPRLPYPKGVFRFRLSAMPAAGAGGAVVTVTGAARLGSAGPG
jgi:hypothetical protein